MNIFWWVTTPAVSYTHLDVYKRQALANSREVSEETVRHVRQVARESGYLRQCKERRLSYRKPSAPTIAVVCPEIISVYYSAIATCLSRLAESHGGTSACLLYTSRCV